MILSGTDIADYMKQRHYEQVRGRRPRPVMAIVQVAEDGPSASYIRAKQRYGQDIGVVVDYHRLEPDVTEEQLVAFITSLNLDKAVDGIVLQLPLPSGFDTDRVVNVIAPDKDIDGLGAHAKYDSATAEAIIWLLGAYDIAIKGRTVAVVGQGRLVGAPVAKMLEQSEAQVARYNDQTTDIASALADADIIISATGQAGLIKNDMVAPDTVVIDAGVGLVGDKLSGDADPALYERSDIKITPTPGGVGPMTVAVLYEHLLRAASQR